MDPRIVRVFVACALGALVGTLVALELNAYLWWVGLVVGATIGYLSFEFKKVVTAIPAAWGKATVWWRTGTKVTPKNMAIVWLGLMMMNANFVILTAIIDRLPGPHTKPLSLQESLSLLMWMAVLYVPIAFFWTRLNPELQVSMGWLSIRRGNPFAVWIYYPLKAIFYWLPKGIVWTVPHIPGALVASQQFLWKIIATIFHFVKFLFLEIHSDLRILCAVDAAVGACIGYLAGSALIGGVVGGIFGVLNYVVVSKKILGLVPRSEG
jgi:hypothetical protein